MVLFYNIYNDHDKGEKMIKIKPYRGFPIGKDHQGFHISQAIFAVYEFPTLKEAHQEIDDMRNQTGYYDPKIPYDYTYNRNH